MSLILSRPPFDTLRIKSGATQDEVRLVWTEECPRSEQVP